MVKQQSELSWLTLFHTVIRSFWLQSCWNFQGMQNIGFGFAMIPVIKAIYLGKQERLAALKRHLEFFNTHPYCAAIILGVVAQLEERAGQSDQPDTEQISRLKSGMMGPLAALGDTVFWATLKPALALCAVALIFTADRQLTWQSLSGLLLFVILYNIFHIVLRIGGVMVGYRRGLDVVQDLRRFNPQLIARRLSFFLAIVTGTLLVTYPVAVIHTTVAAMLGVVSLFAAMTALMVFCIKKKITVAILIYGMMILAILIAWTGLVPFGKLGIGS